MDALSGLDWSLLQVFIAVAEEGSLSGVARRLGRSQPTLGRQARAVEEALGLELFERHAKGLTLTEAGTRLVEPARAMHEAAGRIALAAAGTNEELAGTVRITASVAVSFHHLPVLLAELRRQEPEIEIELVPSDESRSLLYREADIALRMYRPQQLDLVAQHLGDLELGLFGATHYLDRVGRPQTFKEAFALDFVGYDALPLIVDGMAAAGFRVTREWFPVRCDDHATQWELVRAGAGLGFAQKSVGDNTPGIEAIETGFPLPPLPLWLTAHERLHRTPRVRRVWRHLAEGLAEVVGR